MPRRHPDAPVVASLTFSEEGTTLYGETPEIVVARLESLGVPVIGANCSQGPAPMLETLKRMSAVVKTAKLAAMPNAGAPALVEGRYAGKIVIFPQLRDLPLSSLEDLASDDPEFARALGDGGVWTSEAEAVLFARHWRPAVDE